RDDSASRAALKGHYRQAHQPWLQLLDQSNDGGLNRRLREHEVGDGDLMMRVDVASERGEAAIRHTDGERRRMLETVWHRHQEDLHHGLRVQTALGGSCFMDPPALQTKPQACALSDATTLRTGTL